MSRTRSYEALILLTRDVGEADRFLILFTREGGKRTARAKGVRKTGSRLGGMLLPMRHLQLELHDSGESAVVTGAVDIDEAAAVNRHFLPFARMAEGMELLLRFTEDDEPLPAVFDLLLQFRSACAADLPDPVLPFQLSLLHHLGLLPVTAEDPRFARLSELGRSFVWSCAHGRPIDTLCALPADRRELKAFRDQLLADHLTRPLASVVVGENLRR